MGNCCSYETENEINPQKFEKKKSSETLKKNNSLDLNSINEYNHLKKNEDLSKDRYSDFEVQFKNEVSKNFEIKSKSEVCESRNQLEISNNSENNNKPTRIFKFRMYRSSSLNNINKNNKKAKRKKYLLFCKKYKTSEEKFRDSFSDRKSILKPTFAPKCYNFRKVTFNFIGDS